MEWLQQHAEWIAQLMAVLATVSAVIVTVHRVSRRVWQAFLLLQRLATLIDTLQAFVEQGSVKDIHGQLERIEHQLCALEQKHRYVFDVIADYGIFECDSHGRCVYVSSKWCEMTGLTQQDALNAGWMVAAHPDDRAPLRKEWEEAVNDKHFFDLAVRFIQRPERTVLPVHIRALPVLKPDGTLISYIGFVRVNGYSTDIGRTTLELKRPTKEDD